MDLRLFQNQCRALRGVITKNNDRQNLRNSEANISNQYFGRLWIAPHPHLKQFPALRDRLHFEAVNEAEVLEPTRYSLLQTLAFVPTPSGVRYPCFSRRQYRVYDPL